MYSISYAVTIATLIYLHTSRLCQDFQLLMGISFLLWRFHTFKELDEEALLLYCKVDLKLDSKVYLHGL